MYDKLISITYQTPEGLVWNHLNPNLENKDGTIDLPYLFGVYPNEKGYLQCIAKVNGVLKEYQVNNIIKF